MKNLFRIYHNGLRQIVYVFVPLLVLIRIAVFSVMIHLAGTEMNLKTKAFMRLVFLSSSNAIEGAYFIVVNVLDG